MGRRVKRVGHVCSDFLNDGLDVFLVSSHGCWQGLLMAGTLGCILTTSIPHRIAVFSQHMLIEGPAQQSWFLPSESYDTTITLRITDHRALCGHVTPHGVESARRSLYG